MTFVSEKDAGEKWCPHSRTLDWNTTNSNAVSASVNRQEIGYDDTGNESVVVFGRHRCIGSQCMAWRWESYRRPEEQSPERRGYCGAFGIPLESVL